MPRRRRFRPRQALLFGSHAALIALSGCAVGDPQQTTDITDVSATLNGDVYSSVVGDTEYWWRYGETTAYGSETPHGTVAISDDQAHPVSETIGGALTPETTYHFQMCAQDDEEDPPRTVCSSDRTFTTAPPSDGSMIAFTTDRDGNDEIYVMDTFGTGETNLTNDPAEDSDPAWSPDRTKIAFVRDGDIYAMDADGSDQTNHTDTEFAGEQEPAWSPDGTKIAYSLCGEFCAIWVMDADGSDQTPLTSHVGTDLQDLHPTWSPDGEQIAFYTNRESTEEVGIDEIYVMDADGGNEAPLTDDLSGKGDPAWSPDGDSIAFSSIPAPNFESWEVYVMDADGSDQVNLTNDPGFDVQPTWSPDGARIAFQSIRDGDDTGDIWVMDADGSDQNNLTDHPANDRFPAWSTAP